MPVDKLEGTKVEDSDCNNGDIIGANSKAADAEECLLAPVPYELVPNA